jgi:hypothetical protein
MKTVAEFSLHDLEALIEQMIERRLQADRRYARLLQRTSDTRPVQAVMESVERHRWTPPSGTPSVVEMLREDRDS